MSAQDIKEVVKERYGAAARRVTTGEGSSCCGASAQCGTDIDPITRDLYEASQTSILPEEAVKASLGLRQSNGAGGTQAGRDGAGPWFRWRD